MNTDNRIERNTMKKFTDSSVPARSFEKPEWKGGSAKVAEKDELRLKDMVGIDTVKKMLEEIMKRITAEREFAKCGLDIDPGPMNFVFTGNPGTAKTTVANLMANELYAHGVLSKKNVVTAGRKDVIGKYEGHTSARMKKLFKDSEGGMLFIDEAYSLVEKWSDGNGGYGKEAIDVLVEELGVPHNDRVVVLAGYPDEMGEFIKSNPGLNSRLNYRINFPDYDAAALYSILEVHACNKNLKIDEKVKNFIMPKLEEACSKKDFGNGRFVVNLLDKAINKQRVRLYDKGLSRVTKNEIVTLNVEDFSDIDSLISALQKDNSRKRIGFRA